MKNTQPWLLVYLNESCIQIYVWQKFIEMLILHKCRPAAMTLVFFQAIFFHFSYQLLLTLYQLELFHWKQFCTNLKGPQSK